MKRILVPIDFSENSIRALEYAIDLCNKLSYGLLMMYVEKSENLLIPFVPEKKTDDVAYSAEEYFERIYNRYVDDYKVENGEFEYRVRQGVVYKEIVNQAKYGDANFIIMGAHGASGFEEFFIGSNSFKVVSHSKCPVLTYHRACSKERNNIIVVPIDASAETRSKLPLVSQLANQGSYEVHVIGVHETQDSTVAAKVNSYLKQSVDYLKKEGVNITIEKELRGENNAKTSMDYADEVNAEILVVMKEQTTSYSNVFIGSYTQQMVNYSKVPLLCVPNI